VGTVAEFEDGREHKHVRNGVVWPCPVSPAVLFWAVASVLVAAPR
jgi:hypothetical protein